nr:MAG TPA: hypothetical protein [Caudoviricetes sp.]DAQ46046.1 MAG TPA: hypothetical protein [Caudoviricetes sp.]DAU27119.1 MAG TPA: hypothetical protein [Bacteriophage sp.]
MISWEGASAPSPIYGRSGCMNPARPPDIRSDYASI